MINISFWNIVFTVVNLLILFVGIRIFFFKPIKKIIDERQKEANTLFDQATGKNEEAEELKKRYQGELESAEAEKRQIIAEARKTADAEYQNILADAKTDAQGIRDAAAVEGERTKNEIINSAKKEVTAMVLDAASKVAGTQTGAEVDSKLFDQFLNKAGE